MQLLGDFVKSWSADLPYDLDRTSSIYGSWYLSPTQHGVEFVLFNLFFVWAFRHFLAKSLKRGTPIDHAIQAAKRAALPTRSRLDVLMALVLTASLSLVTFHKYNSGNLNFLLQPCHVSMVTLIVMLLWDQRSSVPHVIFNIYLHTVWGTLLAILSPDLRDAKQFLERDNFWFEHWALLITPLIVAWSNRLAIFPPSFDLAMASFLFKALYHSLVLSAVALRTGNNLNYMLEPPLGPLELFAELYRLVMYLFCCALTFFTRYVLVKYALKMVPRRKRVEASQKQKSR
ncbi:transmembrane protein [Catenaria anguillulae PL171]|uniref:Transmembrane protein n=1 Tax=Catenaria anguillulae PL171 TaxID=765915 RepID=A0A1Y2HTB0_9FUNG|nr:transmembrane protein [Catenaria anguillulae PL171]